MKRWTTCALFAALATVALAESPARLTSLRSELLENPIGIDATKPRFSWKMEDARRDALQKAFQLQVASSKENLLAGKADVWDSGKQETSASTAIQFGGADLKPLTGYAWRVKAWDKDGEETAFSEPATVETGFVNKDNWKAKWIAAEYKEAEANESYKDVSWIWHPEAKDTKAPGATRYFQKEFEVPAGATIKTATAWCLADNQATIYINGKLVQDVFGFKAIAPEDIAKYVKPGKNVVQIAVKNESDGHAGLAWAADVTLADGKAVRVITEDSWQVSPDIPSNWPETPGAKAEYVQAKILGKIGMKPWNEPNVASKGGPASQHRKEFDAAAAPVSARLYITALGSYRAEINGQRVGKDILTPDWTDYRNRVMYQTYDVTSMLKQGKNAIGVTLGDGWYASALGWQLERLCFGVLPTRFRAELHIRYADGKEETVLSDGTWKTAQSPILRSEIYAGETYDARLEQAGWSTAGFNDSKWTASLTPETTSTLPINGQASPPIRVEQELTPIAITEPKPGVYVVDMGQNMVGWARLKVKGNAGDSVKMRFAEILNPDGTIYTTNLRRAEATDTYTLKGGAEEVFEPHFTYHGFRYIEVTGFPGGAPTKDNFTGVVFYTGSPFVGKFESSNPMVARIVTNTMWGLKGNLMSVPTDCPQRDERLGWTGDAQAIWKTAIYNLDVESFTEKWTRDLEDSQGKGGDYPNVAPRIISKEPGAPAWGNAGVILPYQAWKMYGDIEGVRKQWDSMERWLNWIGEANPSFIWLERRGNDYGDWVPANSVTDKALIATAYWAGDALRMAEMAEALGKADRAAYYREVYGKIRKAFQDKFIAADGKIANGSQTCYILALDNKLVPDDKVEAAMTHLTDDITSRGNHLSTGFLGSTYLMPVLTDHGRNDVAVTLLLNKTYPSWGYMIEKGATTIWERWNSDTGDPSMNSFNHYCYGAVTDWLYGHFAGIRPAIPGFKEILIEPWPDERVESAKATYDSSYGKIASGWKHTAEGLELKVTIPANTVATVALPGLDAAKITEGGKSLTDAGLKPETASNGRVKVQVGSGEYAFLIKK